MDAIARIPAERRRQHVERQIEREAADAARVVRIMKVSAETTTEPATILAKSELVSWLHYGDCSRD